MPIINDVSAEKFSSNAGCAAPMPMGLYAAYGITALCVAVPALAIPIGAVAVGAAVQAVKQSIAD